MFENLANELRKAHAVNVEEKAFYIENGFFQTWNDKTPSDNGLKAYSTETRWSAYQAGKITREQAVAYAIKRAEKQAEKELSHKLHRLEVVAAAPVLEWVSIHVYWKRSSTWGYNPTAEASSNAGETVGRASGCGYDKGSTAVAEALNRNNAALRVLYTAAEKALSEGKQPNRKGLVSGCVSWCDILGYGSGYSILPYFEGGVGVSEYAHIFENCGYKWSSNRSAKHYDHYVIEKMEG